MKNCDDEIDAIRTRFEKLSWTLDERMRRLFAAAEASVLGRGGVTKVARATGISCRAIHVGLDELATGKSPSEGLVPRIRKPGAGRKSVIETEAGVMAALDLQELTHIGRRVSPKRPYGEPSQGDGFVARARLQLAGQSQDVGRNGPSRSQCPVRIYQRPDQAASARGRPSYFG